MPTWIGLALRLAGNRAQVVHEASTSKSGENQLLYSRQRGVSPEDAINMIVSGFCKRFYELPMELAVEAHPEPLGVSLGKTIKRRERSSLASRERGNHVSLS